MTTQIIRFVALAAMMLFSLSALAQRDNDPHVHGGGKEFKNNREVISPLTLQRPIYECADTVVVSGYIPHAKIEIFIASRPDPVGGGPAEMAFSQTITVSAPFVKGQVVTAVQTFDGVPSRPSNAVTVTSYKDDFPDGLPQSRLAAPCLDCGRSVGIADVIPGAWWKVFAEDPAAGGGFSPPAEVGGNKDFSYTFLNRPFKKGQRITAQSGICADKSVPSLPEIVQAEPTPIPLPIVDPVYEGATLVTAWGPSRGPLLNGADIKIFTDNMPPGNRQVGGQSTPGGGQQVFISPPAPSPNTGGYWATQALCTPGAPGPKTVEQPCSSLPPAKIRQPLPGDTVINVTEFLPGSRITIYAGTQEIGDGGGSQVTLTRPINDGEVITVIQSMGTTCVADLVYTVTVGCSDRDGKVCSSDWPAFRHSGLRDGQQPFVSLLADPEKIKTLKIKWKFQPSDGPRGFRASAIVYKGRVYLGNANGRLYALDASTGNLLWEYPRAGDPPLLSRFAIAGRHNPSGEGLAASAAIGATRERDAVIFAAPDQSIGRGFGSGRLFALDPVTGAELWKSPEIATLNGLTTGSTSELHENIGYSSPLVLGNRTYVGIADHADSPIQHGHAVAVDTNSGTIVGSFSFSSTNTRGGGIWSSLAGGLDPNAVYATTGNARQLGNGNNQSPPIVDNSLSLLRLNATTGGLDWKLKPVPFDLDNDPDWASGPTLLDARCGNTVASTQKDGWSYAVRSGLGSGGIPGVRWQFPPTGIPFASGTHGDTRYLIPGAGWNDTFITTTGGYTIEAGRVPPGLTRLHALDVCAEGFNPARWIADIPGTTKGSPYQLGPPTVTRGIVFVGTAQGHLVVLADPSVWPASGSICSNPEISNADCAANGFPLVSRPNLLVDIDLDAADSEDSIFTEPVLADGRVFVATTHSDNNSRPAWLYMLEPSK